MDIRWMRGKIIHNLISYSLLSGVGIVGRQVERNTYCKLSPPQRFPGRFQGKRARAIK